MEDIECVFDRRSDLIPNVLLVAAEGGNDTRLIPGIALIVNPNCHIFETGEHRIDSALAVLKICALRVVIGYPEQ